MRIEDLCDLAEIVGTESAAPCERNRIEPELRFISSFGNMHVRGFVRFAGKESDPITALSRDRRHGDWIAQSRLSRKLRKITIVEIQ
jgi:hypothetical protein